MKINLRLQASFPTQCPTTDNTDATAPQSAGSSHDEPLNEDPDAQNLSQAAQMFSPQRTISFSLDSPPPGFAPILASHGPRRASGVVLCALLVTRFLFPAFFRKQSTLIFSQLGIRIQIVSSYAIVSVVASPATPLHCHSNQSHRQAATFGPSRRTTPGHRLLVVGLQSARRFFCLQKLCH
ncbi:hypothetical protein BCR34DRAFT_587644 [Clohesyomyces aquaticus]|uniref:Uncharacterized protein n=1 Tax=Clohesyomyces aquaticus TaxID=1231657 RepID=A0A1Y1ZPR3_9PLEO|nr:hypothetical protein BCR34DRAFT_587644 [Clohesyomyces aquaticus]